MGGRQEVYAKKKKKRNRVEGRERQTILDPEFCISDWGYGSLTGRAKWLGNVGLASVNARCIGAWPPQY